MAANPGPDGKLSTTAPPSTSYPTRSPAEQHEHEARSHFAYLAYRKYFIRLHNRNNIQMIDLGIPQLRALLQSYRTESQPNRAILLMDDIEKTAKNHFYHALRYVPPVEEPSAEKDIEERKDGKDDKDLKSDDGGSQGKSSGGEPLLDDEKWTVISRPEHWF